MTPEKGCGSAAILQKEEGSLLGDPSLTTEASNKDLREKVKLGLSLKTLQRSPCMDVTKEPSGDVKGQVKLGLTSTWLLLMMYLTSLVADKSQCTTKIPTGEPGKICCLRNPLIIRLGELRDSNVKLEEKYSCAVMMKTQMKVATFSIVGAAMESRHSPHGGKQGGDSHEVLQPDLFRLMVKPDVQAIAINELKIPRHLIE